MLDDRVGFFDDNSGMFRIAAIFAGIALLFLIIKLMIDRRKRAKFGSAGSNVTIDSISKTNVVEGSKKRSSTCTIVSSTTRVDEDVGSVKGVKEPEPAVLSK